ncbi:hypothetical protein XELAEV_18037188mg [Xenopus laevis]|uniref:Uncharacterized protein n=1 Tax=Xenopus laevis TaxID=8355 RepID=A0A974CBW4_XENLA|nr:hypothetical protein XELAEV_18037188mg [Xenopus laevis]
MAPTVHEYAKVHDRDTFPTALLRREKAGRGATGLQGMGIFDWGVSSTLGRSACVYENKCIYLHKYILSQQSHLLS